MNKPHVRRTDKGRNSEGELVKPVAWCGAEIGPFDWNFVDAEHAALSAARGQNLRPCSKCADAIVSALKGVE